MIRKSRPYQWLSAFRLVVLAIALTGFVSAGVGFGMYDQKYLQYPQQPDPTTSRTVPYNVKSIIVYVTKKERDEAFKLKWIAVGLGMFLLINLLLNLKWPVEGFESTTTRLEEKFPPTEAEFDKKSRLAVIDLVIIFALSGTAIIAICWRHF